MFIGVNWKCAHQVRPPLWAGVLGVGSWCPTARDHSVTDCAAAELNRRRLESNRLGRYRWVVERTLSWLNRFRRLKIRYEHRADIHLAFLLLGCALISLRFLG